MGSAAAVAELPAAVVPVAAVLGRGEGHDDVMAHARCHVTVAAWTPVALHRLVRLEAAHLEGAEDVVPPASFGHARSAQSTSATATATPATTKR